MPVYHALQPVQVVLAVLAHPLQIRVLLLQRSKVLLDLCDDLMLRLGPWSNGLVLLYPALDVLDLPLAVLARLRNPDVRSGESLPQLHYLLVLGLKLLSILAT